MVDENQNTQVASEEQVHDKQHENVVEASAQHEKDAVESVENNEIHKAEEVSEKQDEVVSEQVLEVVQEPVFSPAFVCGGTGPEEPADEKIQELVDGLKEAIHGHVGKAYPKLQAVSYKSQCVAGTNYFIKVDAGDEHIHLRVFKHFLDVPAELHGVQTGKSDSDLVEYFSQMSLSISSPAPVDLPALEVQENEAVVEEPVQNNEASVEEPVQNNKAAGEESVQKNEAVVEEPVQKNEAVVEEPVTEKSEKE